MRIELQGGSHAMSGVGSGADDVLREVCLLRKDMQIIHRTNKKMLAVSEAMKTCMEEFLDEVRQARESGKDLVSATKTVTELLRLRARGG